MKNTKRMNKSFIVRVVVFLIGTSVSLICAKPGNVVEIKLIGTYSWELIVDIDNSKNEGSFQRTITVHSSISTVYNNLLKSIKESEAGANLNLELNLPFEVLSIGAKAGLDFKAKQMLDQLLENRQDSKFETTKTDVYTVGPFSRFTLYRLVFKGPGITQTTDTVSSIPHQIHPITLSVKIKQFLFLKGIDIIYTEDSVSRPNDIVREVNGLNPDINKGFGGAFVWLKPIWTKDPDQGVTSLRLITQHNENRAYKDLAKGAGGDFRYLLMIKDRTSNDRIISVGLRREREESRRGSEWTDCTEDINKGRKGDFLYLCWNTVQIL